MVRAIHPTMPETYWVPRGWQHRVCTCPTESVKYHTTKEGFVGFVCKNCEKYFRWSLIRCKVCGEFYLMRFSHPEWCPHDAACLDCLQAGHKNTCTRSCSIKPFSDYKYEEDRRPLPPKTEEEIDAALADFTSFTGSSIDFDF